MNRTAAETFIHENFGGIVQDWPWPETPEYAIFRHADNRKWFALFMTLPGTTLGLALPDPVDALNLKSDPDLIDELRHTPGILPAYHMNKRHWLTVLLDGSCPDDRLCSLIALSYRLTAARPRTPRPQPPSVLQ